MPSQSAHTSRPWQHKFLFLTVVMACISTCVPLVYAQFFSPGKLSKAHKHLEGLRNCKKCHIGGREVKSRSCLKCHTPLLKQVNRNRGYHGKMSRTKLMKCETCHTEHKGRAFKIVYWKGGMSNFKHTLAGYTLHHKHARVDCRKCHTSKFIKPALRPYYTKWKRLNQTFLGLPQTCKSCHQDPHQGQVSQKCESCHSERGWNNAHRFSHSRTRFPLHNKHRDVACKKCHKPLVANVKGALEFKVARNCSSCHKDVHGGKMKRNCERCHTDAGWKPHHFVKSTHAPRRFPLTGAHTRISCAACHGPKQDKVVRASCKSCHKTPHSPSFPTNCAKCHNTTTWLKSNFSRAQHQKTRFPLHGKHKTVPCKKCHLPEITAANKRAGKPSRYKMPLSRFADCSPCHKDIHKGQFAKHKCTKCHNEERFEPSLFGVAAHAKTKFPLEHSHLAVPCNACHTRPKSQKDAPVQYHFANQNCQSCHNNPHKQMYKAVIASKGCEGCHSVKAWTDVDLKLFKHEMTGFALTGKHKTTKCEKCHTWKRRESGRVLPHYKLGTSTCRSCHTDIHFGQFDKGQTKADCASCHLTDKWKDAKKFSHDKARFKLTGAHKKVKCTSCHKAHTLPNQKKTTLYRPIKHANCVDCHTSHHEGEGR